VTASVFHRAAGSLGAPESLSDWLRHLPAILCILVGAGIIAWVLWNNLHMD
jgi:hypothetical protein